MMKTSASESALQDVFFLLWAQAEEESALKDPRGFGHTKIFTLFRKKFDKKLPSIHTEEPLLECLIQNGDIIQAPRALVKTWSRSSLCLQTKVVCAFSISYKPVGNIRRCLQLLPDAAFRTFPIRVKNNAWPIAWQLFGYVNTAARGLNASPKRETTTSRVCIFASSMWILASHHPNNALEVALVSKYVQMEELLSCSGMISAQAKASKCIMAASMVRLFRFCFLAADTPSFQRFWNEGICKIKAFTQPYLCSEPRCDHAAHFPNFGKSQRTQSQLRQHRISLTTRSKWMAGRKPKVPQRPRDRLGQNVPQKRNPAALYEDSTSGV